MGETIPGGNINQTAGDWHWRQRPGWGAPNPIPSDAPTQSTLVPPKVNPIALNQDPIVPNKGTPVVTTKNADGSTATAHGTIAGTTVTFNSPA